MTVVLTKKITLKCATVYLRLQRKVKREDIQNYLQGNHFNNSIVENRVREYLKSIGIYNEQGTTPYGDKVKETGMVDTLEEGKYQIWFTQDDFLFGNRIFYFKRVKPEPYNQQLVPLKLDFSRRIFRSLPIKDAQDTIEFLIIDAVKEYPAEIRDAGISCTWTWNDTQSSLFKFSGNFETAPIDSKPVDFDINLEQHIPTIIPNWNSETRRNKLKIENIENNDIYQYFEYSGSRPRDGYDSCVFDKLPVEPYNEEEAREWRDKIINMELEKKYMHPDDFTDSIIMINQKEGFSAYSGLLDVPDMSRYIEKLEPGKKSDRKPAYWHLAAPLDLNVGIPKSLKIDSGSFSLSREGDKNISFRELAAKFGEVQAERIFYYDKYVSNYYQQRSVSVFLNSFGVSDICIITDTTQNDYNDYLSQKKQEINVTGISSVYQNLKDAPHDRFIVFKSERGLLVWTSTNSIDFVRFDKNEEITPDTSGSILKSVTFTKVKPDVLGTQLTEFILRG
jgi:hypothetical protein